MNFYQTMQKYHLNDKPIWTVSTTQKQPINPKLALQYHFSKKDFEQWFEFAKNPKDCLVTLDELLKEPRTPKNKLALHVDIDKQHIMLVDMETEFDPKVKPILQHLPAIYGEKSMHNGHHYIVVVPDNILNDPKYTKLFMRTQVKFGEIDDTHSGVEIFFHNHYLTFTQNQVKSANQNTDDDLRQVLDYILEINKINEQNLIKPQDFVDSDSEIPTDALVVANHTLTPRDEGQIKSYIRKNKTVNNSEREYKNLYIIGNHIVRSKKNHFALMPFGPDELIDPNAFNDPKILTWVLIHFAYQYIEFRDKWNKPVTGNQSYIQYSCNKVMTKLLSKQPDNQQ